MVVPYVGLEQLLRQGEGVLGQHDGERQQHRLTGGGAAGAAARGSSRCTAAGSHLPWAPP